jgi:putative membrane protein
MTEHDRAPAGGAEPDGAPASANGAGPEDIGAEDVDGVPGTGRSRRGMSARVLGDGTDPDPRFTLANERTFLAWIRTSLALVAGGIAVEAFTSGLFGPELRKTVAVLLLLLGMMTGGGSFFRWLNVERAMRRQTPLPVPLIAPILAAGGALVAALLVVFVIARPA